MHLKTLLQLCFIFSVLYFKGNTLNIYADLRLIDSSTDVSAVFKDYYKSVIEASISYMNWMINRRSVLSPSEPIHPNSTSRIWSNCNKTNFNFPTDVNSTFDFFLQFRIETSLTSAAAQTFVCQRTASGAPTIGFIQIRPTNMIPNNAWTISQTALQRERDINLLLHEFMHALGINNYDWTMWRDPVAGTNYNESFFPLLTFLNGNTYRVAKIPKLINWLKDYLNCPGATEQEIPGLPFSNISSHPVTKIFPFEASISGYYYDLRFSELNLRILDATGFWTVNSYSRAEPFIFGKNAGCNFLNSATSPNEYEGYCDNPTSVRKCTFQRSGWGICSTLPGSVEEKVVRPNTNNFHWCWNGAQPSNNFESFNQASKCFEGSRSTPYCLHYRCTTQAGNSILHIRNPSNTANVASCYVNGASTVTIPGTSETINCPDPNTFCNGPGLRYCPRRCTGNGVCNTSGQDYYCVCNPGWSGYDCSQKNGYTFYGI